MNVDPRALVGRLNHDTRNALEGAAGLCVSRTHYDVEVEHFLTKLLDDTSNDAAQILKHFDVNRSRLAKDLTESLDLLKTGNPRTPALSPKLVNLLSNAWLICSLEQRSHQVRTGHAILALVSDADLRRLANAISREFENISAEELKESLEAIISKSSEEEELGGEPDAPGAPGKPTKTPKLDQYTHNLTERARSGEMDPVLGRDFEVRQVVDILTRRRQNNPILVGEAGVGKTAVVEGFAMRVVKGDVPDVLKNVTIRTLDLALLQAGAGVKGEFENRLKGLIQEVKSSPSPIILFIDEAHTMIGAGGAAGQGDAANLLKPALARGELRTLAATTWSEYKKYIEKDPALARRFQLIKVEEPDEGLCQVMLRGVVPSLEKHHTVRILEEGMEAAVRLSARYLSDRQLPDKAVSVLDTACARLALGQSATPAPIEAERRRLDDLAVQDRVLQREQATGADHAEYLAEIAEMRASTEAELAELTERWEKERALVLRIRELRETLEATASGDGAGDSLEPVGAESEDSETSEAAEARENPEVDAAEEPPSPPADPEELRAELMGLNEELDKLQGENPLVPVCVDGELVGQVISGWTGIPVGKMMRDEAATALELEKHLGERIIGQDHVLEVVSHRIRTSYAKIEDPGKPKGVFLFVGPSGVGKTEMALTLADLLFGGERNMVTINMSEFQEAHTVSTLKGSPPGYVGYGEGGILTEAVRRRPYSVVLLDEIEKAHPDVLELFFQVFDKGRMEDAEGRVIDFKNTVIILTTNAGTDTIMTLCDDPETMPTWEGLGKALKPELDGVFKPAFLGRTVIIPFFPLRDEPLKTIVRLKLNKIRRRLEETRGMALTYEPALEDEIAQRCTEVESGARNIDNILSNTVLPDLSRVLLEAMLGGEEPTSVNVSVGDKGQFEYTLA
ncbi:MAG: type VI secretion system ATPase TssH [Gemmatimonadetes bacterium]|nr:type VI secretion system ATPase TssH [Gemmatimonadota bacterium]